MKEFVEYYIKHGAKLAKEVKYVPLPAKAYNYNLETHRQEGKLGTKFGGENKVGLTHRGTDEAGSQAVSRQTLAGEREGRRAPPVFLERWPCIGQPAIMRRMQQ